MTAPEVLAAKKHDCDTGAPQQRAELAALASAENWVELLRRCEVELEPTPFWLDLTYWTIKAAEHVLGKDAARTLKGELVALVMRHPDAARWLRSQGTMARVEGGARLVRARADATAAAHRRITRTPIDARERGEARARRDRADETCSGREL